MYLGKCRIPEAGRLFSLWKFRILRSLGGSDRNQLHSASGSPQWHSQMCHWGWPFLSALYSYYKKSYAFR